MNITTKLEGKRGCGYRKQGGTYLVCDSPGVSCGLLPIALTTCPCCGQGIKFSRAPQKVSPKLIDSEQDKRLVKEACLLGNSCNKCIPFFGYEEEYLILDWVGKAFYKTTQHFGHEADRMGISRRIPPSYAKLIVPGKIWVLLAHLNGMTIDNYKALYGVDDYIRKAELDKKQYVPAIFRAYCPDRIEYVVKDDDSDEKLESIEKRGISLVKVKKATDEKDGVLEFPQE